MAIRVTSILVRDDVNTKWYWETDAGKIGLAAFTAYKKENYLDTNKASAETHSLSADKTTLTVIRDYENRGELDAWVAESTAVDRIKLASDYNASNGITRSSKGSGGISVFV